MGADSDDEDFVSYGTPIEREEDISGRKRRAIAEAGQLRALPAWKQEVWATLLNLCVCVSVAAVRVMVSPHVWRLLSYRDVLYMRFFAKKKVLYMRFLFVPLG